MRGLLGRRTGHGRGDQRRPDARSGSAPRPDVLAVERHRLELRSTSESKALPEWLFHQLGAPASEQIRPTIWESPAPKFMMGGSEEDKFDHPTQKPLELMRRPIVNHTKRGEWIYDPFLGSGTTLMAAERAGRLCCGLRRRGRPFSFARRAPSSVHRSDRRPGHRGDPLGWFGDAQRSGDIDV